jgi:uncharacterized protein (TIGR04222 family)
MNPFDLPGPQFLLFYSALGLTVTLSLLWTRRQHESLAAPTTRLDDPYLVAMLRGGGDEAVRLALLSLLDRKLIVTEAGDHLARAPDVTTAHVRRDIEKAILKSLDRSRSVDDVLAGVRADFALQSYENTLKRMNLLPGPEHKARRMKLWAAGFGVLFVVAVIKVGMGISRNRPVLLLVLEGAAFAVATVAICFPRRTLSGDQLVTHMRELFSSLKDRAGSLRAGGETSDLTWLGAVFGLAAVPGSVFPHTQLLTPKRREVASGTSCGSSSCGSSCGGGGCGGGCGGCGS